MAPDRASSSIGPGEGGVLNRSAPLRTSDCSWSDLLIEEDSVMSGHLAAGKFQALPKIARHPPAPDSCACGTYRAHSFAMPALRNPTKYVASNKARIFGAPKGPIAIKRAMLE